jgi:hypothetical protein
MKFICVTKCIFRKRLWIPGETLESLPGEKMPKHFKEKSDLDIHEKKLIDDTPKTMHEMNQQEAIEQAKIREKIRVRGLEKEKELEKEKLADDAKTAQEKWDEDQKENRERDRRALDSVGHGRVGTQEDTETANMFQ